MGLIFAIRKSNLYELELIGLIEISPPIQKKKTPTTKIGGNPVSPLLKEKQQHQKEKLVWGWKQQQTIIAGFPLF